MGNLGLIPGLGRSSGEGKGYPLQYSGLENSVDCIVHGVTKNRTGLSNFHFYFQAVGLVLWLPLDENSERSYSLSGTYSVIEGPTGPVEIPGGASGKEPACQVHET